MCQMRSYIFRINFLIISTLLVSCTVSNNLYVNNPVPLTKLNFETYGGIGMGLKPKIDSVSIIGEVFSSSFSRTINLVAGGRYGITHVFNISGSIHLPQVAGGVGLSIRPQLSMFPNITNFNLGVAVDIGGVIATDSIRIAGIERYRDLETRGAYNVDFSLPMALKLAEQVWIIVTPRYSFNSSLVRKEYGSEKNNTMNAHFPVLSLGLRLRKYQLESTVIHFNNKQQYMFGIVYFFGFK